MDDKMIEYLYKSGKMPKKYYNQLNGKTAQENYADYINTKSNLNDLIPLDELQNCIENAVDDIIKALKG